MSKVTDIELLDFLQRLLDEKRYTGKCVLRWSDHGRGFRLHETSATEGVVNIREAIQIMMDHQKLERKDV